MNTKFEHMKEVRLQGGPMNGALWSGHQLYPPGGILEFFRREGDKLETCRYRMVVKDEEIVGEYLKPIAEGY
jgi:hypothetical protein